MESPHSNAVDYLNEIIFLLLNSSLGHGFKIFMKVLGDNIENRVITYSGNTECWGIIPWQVEKSWFKITSLGYNQIVKFTWGISNVPHIIKKNHVGKHCIWARSLWPSIDIIRSLCFYVIFFSHKWAVYSG